MSDPVQLCDPAILVNQWVPMGRNDLTALNRFLGSHKRYTSATEFGIEGRMGDLDRGSFQMEREGVLLRPSAYEFSTFVDLEMTDRDGTVAMHVDHAGTARASVRHRASDTGCHWVDVVDVKRTAAQLEHRLVRGFYPVLTEPQRDLLETLYGSERLTRETYRTVTYALVIAPRLSVPVSSARSFLEEHPQALTGFTDWIQHAFSAHGCHVFVGMAGTVVVGKPTPEVRHLLEHILTAQTLFAMSQRLYSRISAMSRRIENARRAIPHARLRRLAAINRETSVTRTEVARLQVLDRMFTQPLAVQRDACQRLLAEMDLTTKAGWLAEQYAIQLDIAADRELNQVQLETEISGLVDALGQRTDEIMTRNGEFMNIVLLVMTILSVVGFGDIFGFSARQMIVLVAIMVPFALVAVFYINHFVRNYVNLRKRARE
jgi:hypothetical protein